MNYYGGKELAASFQTVRNNTIAIAEDIPEDKYNFRAAEGTQSVAELLTHIALGPTFQQQVNLIEKRTTMVGFDFFQFMAKMSSTRDLARSKSEIVSLLRVEGEKFAQALAALSDEFLGEAVTMPPQGNVPYRTRFDMLMSVKEHEMHHRGQLMLMERMLGITPHLTLQQEARVASMRAAMAQNS